MADDQATQDVEDALNALVDDGDFREIDQRLARFNLFEAMGGVRAELRHSNFLAFLLSPRRVHGLGPLVLERVLRAILADLPADRRPLRTLELMVADLDDAIVYRERQNIDLLIELTALNLVVLIENKVGAGAGEGQLERYKATLEARYPHHRRLMVFLTPNGDDPNCEGFVPFSYQSLARVLEQLAAEPSTPSEPSLILTHYVEMLRRHVVPDDDLKDLARRLYEKHRGAFDFVFEARPQLQGLLDTLKGRVLSVGGLEEDSVGGNLFRFYPSRWERFEGLKCPPQKWSKTGRGLLFETMVYPDGSAHLTLILGPCAPEVRARILEGCKASTAFKGMSKRKGDITSRLYHRELLSSELARTTDFDQQLRLASLAWSNFQGEDLMELIAEIEALAGDIENSRPARGQGPTDALGDKR